jgi:hypothetical protein
VTTTPEEILEELQALQDDPEKLKVKAAELAAQVTKEAESTGGIHAGALKELASDLETVAADGDLSVIEEKIARGAAGGKPAGAKTLGPSGMSGGTGASIKWIEALVKEDDDEDDEELSVTEALEEYFEELEESKEAAESAESTESAAADPGSGLINRLLGFYNQQAQYSLFSVTA